MNENALLALYRAMYTARQIDKVEQELTQRGAAFFHVSGAGHEASAAIALHLTSEDWLHCHYRDKALLIARGLPIREFFDSVMCKQHSSSHGRQMSAFVSCPELKILSVVTPTGNNALQAAGVAAATKNQPSRPIVVCGIGDGTAQQGEVLEALGEAARDQLPLLLVVHDNRLAISTHTAGRTFFSLPTGDATSFQGIPIHYVDGRHPARACHEFGRLIRDMRVDRKPCIVVMRTERLASHTNADDQRIYRSADEIQGVAESGDPIPRLAAALQEAGVAAQVLADIRADAERRVAAAVEESAAGPDPVAEFGSKVALPVELTHPSYEIRGDDSQQPLIMGHAIREVLRQQLATNPQVFLYGEDIEDPKGDVFGVTKGLSTQFVGRVRNSPLSESTILGTAVGRALAGQRPVAFIQFADFLPLTFNQLTSELATMYWRTAGQWQAPVIVMAACGAYRPGLGPYHAQTFEGFAAHCPGLDICMPSHATDAAGMLNAAFQSGRPTLFLYPKAMLNDRARATLADVSELFVPIGVARKTRVGRDLTLVGWGNAIPLCERAAEDLVRAGAEVEVIDLRSISPWDERMVLQSAEKTARLVVVHEDNQTCGLGGEILATIAERSRLPVAMRRVTRPDTFVPCNFANQVELLPSYRRVLATAADLLDFDVTWDQPPQAEDGLFDVPAIGSAPSDETVTLVEYLVRENQEVERGAPLASVEAAKSVFEIAAPVAGTVMELPIQEGESISVGKTLLRLRVTAQTTRHKTLVVEESGTPILVKRQPTERYPLPKRGDKRRAFEVGVSDISAVTGSREVSNREVLVGATSMTPEDIVRLTGIERRNWINDGEDAVTLAVRAARHTLDKEELAIDDLDLVICSTTSPTTVTPSMACRVLNGLVDGKSDTALQAFDINAACSGYLYALQAGYDFLQSKPDSRVLVVTTEVLSPLLNREDLDTAILFGDAASATVLYGESHFEKSCGRLFRPELSAKGEDGSSLMVPFRDHGFIHMRGRKVFTEAVRSMITSLNRVCQREGLGVEDLRLIVPHQANQRIIDAIQGRVAASVYSNIRRYGNTSSTSIPLCLSELLPHSKPGDRLGLCAFGGGFTFGASIIQAT